MKLGDDKRKNNVLQRITIFLCLLMHTFLLQNCNGMPAIKAFNTMRDTTVKLSPYPDENGRYGYVNKEMEFVIPARYSSASSFTSTGFAIVSEANEPLHIHDNRYGIINEKGELVVPYEYDRIHLEVLDGHTLIWAKQIYLNRWRFWEWEGILFGDNFLSNAPLIDTKVRRAKVQLGVLESGQLIHKKRTYGLAPLLEAIPFEMLDSTCFLQGDQLYHLQNGKPIRIAKNIYGKTSTGLLLQQRGAHYRLIDFNGDAATDATYKKRKHLRINIDGKNLLFSVENIKKMPTVYGVDPLRYVFEGETGKQYLFPDFESAFPNRVDALAQGDIAVEAVLNRSRLTPGSSGSGRFYFHWNYVLDEQRIFEIDGSGTWKRHSDGGDYQKWLKDHAQL